MAEKYEKADLLTRRDTIEAALRESWRPASGREELIDELEDIAERLKEEKKE